MRYVKSVIVLPSDGPTKTRTYLYILDTERGEQALMGDVDYITIGVETIYTGMISDLNNLLTPKHAFEWVSI